jgi:hypothetical protein
VPLKPFALLLGHTDWRAPFGCVVFELWMVKKSPLRFSV